MRLVLFFLLSIISINSFAQPALQKTTKDTLILVSKNAGKGFMHDYALFIPKGTLLNSKTFLLVEPNNTGVLSDDDSVHLKAAIQQAAKSSLGNNIATELDIPFLVPAFPRPASDSLLYTHALDRDIMLKKEASLKRLDLQLIKMIDDAKLILASLNIQVAPKIFMNGFSASGTFTNRFSMMHPGKIQALAIGGFNGELMLPQDKINGIKINYPLGTNDFKKITGKKFDINSYRKLPQYIYMGKLDDNDAVQFDDAYDENERRIINSNKASNVHDRFIRNQQLYKAKNINPIFITYENVGHWTTSSMNLELIRYFMKQMKEAL